MMVANDRRRRRRGLAIAPAMICIVLVLLVCAGLMRQTSTLRRESKAKQERMQSVWLLESGLSRAAAKLAADRKYAGETWEIKAEELGLAYPGTVRIEVKPSGDAANSNQVKVRVEADYPRGDLVERHRSSQTLLINLGPETSGGTS